MTTVDGPDLRDRARRSPTPSISDEIRVVGMVWERELIRYVRTRTRIMSGLIQPVLFLFVLGYGMSGLVGTTGGFNFRQFVYPGVVAMSVVMTAMFSALSIVWDREFGFLREMLVAPVSRVSLVLGKTAGGATVAAAQGTIMLVLAPLVGIRLTPVLVVQVIALELLMAVAMTAFGVFVASRIQKMESFQVVMQMLLMPMLFLSGRAVPPQRPPGMADGDHPAQPPHLRRRPPPPGDLRRPGHVAGRPGPVPDQRHAVRLHAADGGRAGHRGRVRPGLLRSRLPRPVPDRVGTDTHSGARSPRARPSGLAAWARTDVAGASRKRVEVPYRAQLAPQGLKEERELPVARKEGSCRRRLSVIERCRNPSWSGSMARTRRSRRSDGPMSRHA